MCNTWKLRDWIRKREIVIALILKAILLGTLWMLCFRDPIEKHLTEQSIKHHWYSVQK